MRCRTCAVGLAALLAVCPAAPAALPPWCYGSEVPTVPIFGGYNCYPRLRLGMECRAQLFQETQWPRTYGPWGAPYSAFGPVRDEEVAKGNKSEGAQP